MLRRRAWPPFLGTGVRLQKEAKQRRGRMCGGIGGPGAELKKMSAVMWLQPWGVADACREQVCENGGSRS